VSQCPAAAAALHLDEPAARTFRGAGAWSLEELANWPPSDYAYRPITCDSIKSACRFVLGPSSLPEVRVHVMYVCLRASLRCLPCTQDAQISCTRAALLYLCKPDCAALVPPFAVQAFKGELVVAAPPVAIATSAGGKPKKEKKDKKEKKEKKEKKAKKEKRSKDDKKVGHAAWLLLVTSAHISCVAGACLAPVLLVPCLIHQAIMNPSCIHVHSPCSIK
jgi:hypothetical protein